MNLVSFSASSKSKLISVILSLPLTDVLLILRSQWSAGLRYFTPKNLSKLMNTFK